jgi:hypothetical protein
MSTKRTQYRNNQVCMARRFLFQFMLQNPKQHPLTPNRTNLLIFPATISSNLEEHPLPVSLTIMTVPLSTSHHFRASIPSYSIVLFAKIMVNTSPFTPVQKPRDRHRRPTLLVGCQYRLPMSRGPTSIQAISSSPRPYAMASHPKLNRRLNFTNAPRQHPPLRRTRA